MATTGNDKRPIICIFSNESDKLNKSFNDLTLRYHKSDENLTSILIDEKPDVIVTIGNNYTNFKHICELPLYYRRRWLHFKSLSDIQINNLYFCWFEAIFDYDVSKYIYSNKQPDKHPLVSIFTPSYKSGKRIQRPLNSLLKQRYNNWEWVIFDDTPANFNNDENWSMLIEIAKSDPRIRIYRTYKNSGVIGEVKYNAASLCRGKLLFEVDHDDDFLDFALERIVEAYLNHPEAGMFYSECCEL